MSNHLAIATVTAALQQFLHNELAEKMPGASVTTVRPETLNNAAPQVGVNLYLFQVTPNQAMRNNDLPMRAAGSGFSQQPQLALDLHYLITCFGKEDRLEPERLLGITATALHGWPVLTRDAITEAIGSVQGGILAGSDLASQSESVKFWPDPFSLDELHKLWSVFSPLPYRLSMVYHASVVLLTADVSRGRALSVRSTPRVDWASMEREELHRVIPPRLFWTADSSIRVQGRNLGGAGLSGRLNGLSVPLVALSDREISMSLPSGIQPGLVQVSVVRSGKPEEPAFESEPLAFVLQPVLAPDPVFRVSTDPRNGNPIRILVVRPQPGVTAPPRAEILLNSIATGGQPSFAYSSARLLAFRIPELTLGKPSDKVMPVPAPLRAAFLVHGGITLSDIAEWSALPGEGDSRIVDREGGSYLLRTSFNPWGVFFGLADTDQPGAMAFQLPDLPPGDYRVRYRTNGVESPSYLPSPVPASDEEAGQPQAPRVTIP